MRASDFALWERRARLGFTYADDGPKDVWRSHALAVLAGEAWEDDCDGLASTLLDLLGREGLPLERRYRLAVAAGRGDQADHMVGCAVDDAGGFWIVGDTFGPCYPASRMRHRPIEYLRLSEAAVNGGLGRWREGAPWSDPGGAAAALRALPGAA